MAATKYTYSISGDFPNHKVDSQRLTHEIGDSSIATTLSHINTIGDDCDIWFDDALSGPDQATLDGLVAAHSGHQWHEYQALLTQLFWAAVEAGVSSVVANGRPAIEIQDGITGFASAYFRWPLPQDSVDRTFRATVQFILKEADTGSKVRIACKVKSQATGEDSSSAFSPEGFVVVTVNYTTIGQVFEAVVDLDGTGMRLGDAVAVQIGRDGANTMGAGDNDDVTKPIQIVSVEVGAA